MGAAPASPTPAIVFAGGDPPPRAVLHHLPGGARVIAADSGLEHAQALGCSVDVVVGDLDSVSTAALERARTEGAAIEQFPADKDATDLELALDAAVASGATRITVVGGHGGRLDHFVANVLLLGSDRFRAVSIDAWIGTAHVVVVRDTTEITGAVGSLCTLLAVGGPAEGITTDALRFPLSDALLLPGWSRGVSNELLATTARVSLTRGTLLSVQPDALET